MDGETEYKNEKEQEPSQHYKEHLSIVLPSGLQVVFASDTICFNELLIDAWRTIDRLNIDKTRQVTGVN